MIKYYLESDLEKYFHWAYNLNGIKQKQLPILYQRETYIRDTSIVETYKYISKTFELTKVIIAMQSIKILFSMLLYKTW